MGRRGSAWSEWFERHLLWGVQPEKCTWRAQAEEAVAELAEDARDAGALYGKYMTKALTKVRMAQCRPPAHRPHAHAQGK